MPKLFRKLLPNFWMLLAEVHSIVFLLGGIT